MFSKWPKLIGGAISHSPRLSVFYAAILGMISPLCTYGTIPIVLQLYRTGTPIAPLIVFLIASSMINPQLFIMTWGGIDLEFILVRVIVIALFSIFIGVVSYIIPEKWIINKKNVFENDFKYIGSCSSKTVFSWRQYLKRVLKSLEFIGFYIVIGTVIGAMIEVLVPGKVIQDFFKAGILKTTLLVSLVSVPTYACGGGAIPFVNSLIGSGMSRGAAIAFFNVGSATRIPLLMALASIIKPLYLALYVVVLIGFSLIIGAIYN